MLTNCFVKLAHPVPANSLIVEVFLNKWRSVNSDENEGTRVGARPKPTSVSRVGTLYHPFTRLLSAFRHVEACQHLIVDRATSEARLYLSVRISPSIALGDNSRVERRYEPHRRSCYVDMQNSFVFCSSERSADHASELES